MSEPLEDSEDAKPKPRLTASSWREARRLIYERLSEAPDRLYGSGLGSNYQAQTLKLSKHFRPFAL